MKLDDGVLHPITFIAPAFLWLGSFVGLVLIGKNIKGIPDEYLGMICFLPAVILTGIILYQFKFQGLREMADVCHVLKGAAGGGLDSIQYFFTASVRFTKEFIANGVRAFGIIAVLIMIGLLIGASQSGKLTSLKFFGIFSGASQNGKQGLATSSGISSGASQNWKQGLAKLSGTSSGAQPPKSNPNQPRILYHGTPELWIARDIVDNNQWKMGGTKGIFGTTDYNYAKGFAKSRGAIVEIHVDPLCELMKGNAPHIWYVNDGQPIIGNYYRFGGFTPVRILDPSTGNQIY